MSNRSSDACAVAIKNGRFPIFLINYTQEQMLFVDLNDSRIGKQDRQYIYIGEINI